MKKTSGTTPLWVNLLAAGITFFVGFVVLPVLVFAFNQDRTARIEASQPKPEVPPVPPEKLPQVSLPMSEGSQEPEKSDVEVAVEPVTDIVPSPVLVEKPKESSCPNDACARLPEAILRDAHQRGCKRIVVQPPTRILTEDELVKVAGLVYGRLTCRHDMTFDWPGESLEEGGNTLYRQDLEKTPVYFRFGSW